VNAPSVSGAVIWVYNRAALAKTSSQGEPMKVLLLQDVYNLGQAGEVKTVADGYGRNYLLPMGLATLATPAALKRAERIKQIAIEKRAREKADADALAQLIGNATLTFSARAGEKGKLYGSITASQIAQALAQRLGLESFDKRKIVLREPIREVGTYSVPVRLSAEVAPKVTVVVLPEGVVTEALPEESTTNTEDHPSDGPADPDG
jgi:large subunit ribosomal protein L9